MTLDELTPENSIRESFQRNENDALQIFVSKPRKKYFEGQPLGNFTSKILTPKACQASGMTPTNVLINTCYKNYAKPFSRKNYLQRAHSKVLYKSCVKTEFMLTPNCLQDFIAIAQKLRSVDERKR
jgi:hypothetical protein